jgi:hypothetical protein
MRTFDGLPIVYLDPMRHRRISVIDQFLYFNYLYIKPLAISYTRMFRHTSFDVPKHISHNSTQQKISFKEDVVFQY